MVVDLHSHAGRCFLVGLPDEHGVVGQLGREAIAESLGAAHAAEVAAIWLASVADLAVLVLDPERGLRAGRDFRPGEAWADHQRQLNGIRAAVRDAGFHVGSTAAHVRDAGAGGQPVVLLSCEGADFLAGDAGRLEEVAAVGVSSLTLVHYRVNDVGDVQTEPPVHGGLSAFGREVVAECNRLGLLIDCAHASVDTTMDVLETSRHPVMISHSHLDGSGGSHPRLLSARHAVAVAEYGGLIGAWPSGFVCRTLADFGDEIVRLIDVVGVDHVGIGTDMDGNYRPVLTEYRQFAMLADHLGAHGLSDREIGKVFGGNALALLDAVRG